VNRTEQAITEYTPIKKLLSATAIQTGKYSSQVYSSQKSKTMAQKGTKDLDQRIILEWV
jgi:hypothetical protein